MGITTLSAPGLDVVASGDPFEMGLEQGHRLRDKIHAASGILAQLEAFQMLRPGWMPFSIFRRVCERRAMRTLDEPFSRDYPEAALRLKGIAKGAGVSLSSLYLFSAMESIMSDKNNCTTIPALGGCSALAVRGVRSASGEPVIVRNFDYMDTVRPLYTMRRSQPRKGLSSIDFTMAPFAGSVDGVNEHGLCITYNYAYTTDTAAPSVPISVVIAETLQRCSTVAEAAEWIRSRPRSGGGILMLADAKGAMGSLEVSSSRSRLRMAGPEENVLFHTNMFWTEPMRQVQMPDAATYTDKAPKVLRGRQLHESAMKRAARLKQLLEREGPLDVSALGGIMADHGVNSQPTDTTICVHGPLWSTTASLQLFPKSRTIRVAFDAACRANTRRFRSDEANDRLFSAS